uniref:Uncharacterized protein n=1 Tax=Nelumbo nucifera TaxID=4432 RepID=A0A822YBP2_NELNU|nr:TPA_asm: hypothetical protein HUJ06_010385 [Nelumbo nucifera]
MISRGYDISTTCSISLKYSSISSFSLDDSTTREKINFLYRFHMGLIQYLLDLLNKHLVILNSVS